MSHGRGLLPSAGRLGQTLQHCCSLQTLPFMPFTCCPARSRLLPALTAMPRRPPPGHTDFEQRQLLMVFTCSKCNTRAAKAFSKQAYESVRWADLVHLRVWCRRREGVPGAGGLS